MISWIKYPQNIFLSVRKKGANRIKTKRLGEIYTVPKSRENAFKLK